MNISIQLTTVAEQNISILNDTITFDEYRVNNSEYIFEQPSESGIYSLYSTDMNGTTEKISEFIAPYYIENREHTRKIAPGVVVQEYGDTEFEILRVPLISEEGIEVTTDFTLLGGNVSLDVVNISIQLTTIAGQNISILNDTLTFDEYQVNRSEYIFEQPSESGIYSLYSTDMYGTTEKVSEFIAPYYIENREHTRKIAPGVVVQEYGDTEFEILRVPLISEEGIEVTTDFTLLGGNVSLDVVNISIQLTTIAGQNISILNDTLTFDEYQVNRSEYIFEQPSESGIYSLYSTDMYGATEKVSEFIAPYYIENREHTRKIAPAVVVQESGVDEFGILRIPLISEEGIEVTTDFTLVGGNTSRDVVNISIQLTTIAGQNISILNDTLTFDEYRVNRSEYIFEQPSESGIYSLYSTDMYGATEKVSEFIVPYYIEDREHTRKIAPALVVQEELIITLNLNVSAVNPEGSVEVSGKAMLQVGETNVTNTNVSIWVDSVFQKNCTTDNSGNYSCDIIAPQDVGMHILKVNMTDENGHYGENSTNFYVRELEIENWKITDSQGGLNNVLNSMEEFNVSIWLREYNGSQYFNVTSGNFDVRVNETGVYGNLSYVSGAEWMSEFIAPSLPGAYTIVLNGTSDNGIYGTNFTTFTILTNFNVTLQDFNGDGVNDSPVTVTDTQGATVCFGNTDTDGKLSCSVDVAGLYNVNTTNGVYAYNLSVPNNVSLLYYPSVTPIGNISVTFLDENDMFIPNATVSIYETGTQIMVCSGYTNLLGMLECGLNSSKNYDLKTRFGTHRQSVSISDMNISIDATIENWRDTFNSDSGLQDNIGISSKENIIVSDGDVKIDDIMLLSANFTSIMINPSQIVSWDRIWINDTVNTTEANITCFILDADNNTLLSIENGDDISSIVNTSIRLFANFTTINDSYTPLLHEWNVSWVKEMLYTEFKDKCLTTDLDSIGFFDVNISLILDDCVNARIEWKENVTLNGSYNLNTAVDFTKGKVSVNSLMYPSLNKTASITMYNLNFGAVEIQRGGSACPSSICQNISYNNMNGLLTFDVTEFTEYEAVEANQSKISNNNTNSLDTRVYLLMKVQWYNGSCGEWIDDDVVYNSTEPMNISTGSVLKLDQFFNGKWKTTNASYGDGTYRVYASVTDENNLVLENIDGTWLNSTFEFTIDTTKPTVILNKPDNDTITNMTSINFNWTATDTFDSNSTCNLTIDGVVDQSNINSPNNTATNYTVTGFADGIHFWNVTCWDDGNNVNTSETWIFDVDTSPPNVTLVSPINYYNTSSLKINFTFNTTDCLAEIQNCSLIINNSLIAYNESTINGTYTTFLDVSVEDGSNQNWTVNCSNGVSTDQPEVRYFAVDSTPPTITIQSPTNDTYNTQSVWFNVTLNEAGGWCGYSLEDAANVTMDGSGTGWYKQNSSMIDGSHNVTFSCNDTYGNMNSSAITQYFTVDIIPPQYSNNQTNSSEAGSYVLFSLYWEDDALAGYIFSFDNGTGTFVNDSYTEMSGTGNWSNATKRVNSTVGATIRWRVYANDTVGNMKASDEYVYFTIAIPPQYSNVLSIPKVGILGNESNFSVDWTDGTALDTCIFSHTFEPTVLDVQEQNMFNRKTGFGSTRYRAQSFTPNISGHIIQASVYLDYQVGTKGDIVYEIRTNDINEPSSTVLGQASIPALLLTTAGWYTANFSTPIPVSMGVIYWITVSSPTASSNNVYRIHYTSKDSYSEGYMAYSFDSGSSWVTQTTYDVAFRLETAEFNYKNETKSLAGTSDTCTKMLTLQYDFVGYWYQCANDSINGMNCTQEQIYQVTQAEDTESPVGELLSPLNNSKMNGNVTILATVSDNVGLDYAYFQWRNSTDPWANLTDCLIDCLSLSTCNPSCIWITSDFENTTEGYEIRVIPVDLSGNENTSVTPFTYVVDRINPVVENLTITYPPGQSHVTNGQTVTLSLSARDPPGTGAGINITEVNLTYLNGSSDVEMVFVSGSKEAGQWSYWELNVTLSGAITGTRIAAISVYDNSTPINNVRTGDIFTVNVDTYSPQHFDISRDACPIYLNANVSYQVRWTDNIDLDYYIFSSNITGIWANDSIKMLTGAENWSVVTKNMTNNGTVGWRIYAFDHVNNSNDTGVQYVTVLSEFMPNPVVSLIGPLSDTITTNTTINFTYNITNLTDSQLDSCELYLDWMLNASDNTLLINDTMNFTVDEITEGYHEWYILCNNTNDGLGMTDTWNFTIDLTSPTITIDSPDNDTYTETQIWFNITLDESGSWCGYSLDGAANVTMTNSSGNWSSQDIFVTDGNHNVTFSCNDTVGNMNASAITEYFTVDTPPTTTLISPIENYNTSLTTVDFTFSVVDKLNTLMICSLYINGTLRSTNTSTFNATETTFSSIGVSSSLNQNWTVNCSDGINMHMSSSRIFNVDITVPVSTSPDDAFYMENSTASINWTLSDNFAGGYYYVTKNELLYHNSTQWSNNTPIIMEINISNAGYWNYTIFYNDSLGNSGVPDEVIITVKDIPNINSVVESADPVDVGSIISIEANITDLDGDLSGKYLVVEGTWYEMLSNGVDMYLANYTPAVEKVYYYYVYANDTLGLYANTTTNNFTAQKGPTITNAGVTPASGNETTDFVITANVTDFNGVDKVYAKFMQPSVFEIELTNETLDIYNVTYNSTTPGMYVFYVWSNDTLGVSSSSSSYNFTIDDTITPIINTVSIMPQEKNETTIINIEANVTDFNLSIVYADITGPEESIRVLTGGNPYSNNTGPIPHKQGFYDVEIVAFDASGNNATYMTNYTVNDTQAPVLNLFTVMPLVGKLNTNFTITANITDNDAVNSSMVNITNPVGGYDVLILLGSNPYSVNFTSTSWLGLYTVSVIASDSAGNTLYSFAYPLGTANFSIADLEVPSINEFNVTPASINTTQNVTISANVTDDNAVNYVSANVTRPDSYAIPVTSFANTTGIYSANFTNTIIPGLYTVIFEAVDIAGNKSIATSNFTANDTIAPQITFYSVDDNTPSVGQNITFTTTSNDNDVVNKVTGTLNITKPDSTSFLLAVSETGSSTSGSPPSSVIVQGEANYMPDQIGNYSANLIIADLANNTVESNLTFELFDTTGPTVMSVNISAVEIQNIIVNVSTDEESNYTFAYDAGNGWNYVSNSTFGLNHMITLPKYNADTIILYYIDFYDGYGNLGRYPVIGILNFTVDAMLEFNMTSIELNITEKQSRTIQVELTNPSSVAINATLDKIWSWTTVQSNQYLNPLQTVTINITLTPDDIAKGDWHVNETITAHGSAHDSFLIIMNIFHTIGDGECDVGELCGTADCAACLNNPDGGSPSIRGLGGLLPVVYECENNTGCQKTQSCVNFQCVDLVCGYCEYPEDYECKSYQCCVDEDCKNGTKCIDYKCVENEEQEKNDTIDNFREKARKAISDARLAISEYSLIRDTMDAQVVLKQAEFAYDNADYIMAIELVQKAMALARNAPLIESEESIVDGFVWIFAIILLLSIIVAGYEKRDIIRKYIVKSELTDLQKIKLIEKYLDKIHPIIVRYKAEGKLGEMYMTRLIGIEAEMDEAKSMLNRKDPLATQKIQDIVNALFRFKKEVVQSIFDSSEK